MKLSDKVKIQSALFCYSYVSHSFASMQNPKYRGEKFSWETWPKWISDGAGIHVYVNVNCPESVSHLLEKHAKETALKIASDLVDLMTR
ncbi:hypothetical protein HNP46_004308 [Pseudomonas nitritireducens]|uniref:Uncharacterized protein n=1 Tax=Pseudomonas nitroreducens TaxID=46680 RepID=A0A7W7KM97_PSENT|nr:hypothetical protein [Pseudomonas nitritireducens]